MRRFVIITKSGSPLTNEAGTVILFASANEAGRWMTAGDRVAEADDQIVGLPAIDHETRNRRKT